MSYPILKISKHFSDGIGSDILIYSDFSDDHCARNSSQLCMFLDGCFWRDDDDASLSNVGGASLREQPDHGVGHDDRQRKALHHLHQGPGVSQIYGWCC